ncbi:MAG: heavy-metal-associated domain-containing protein [Eubacteriaceae bacterium]|nr:heavy-metal-associated domain-containing protein [Eubacteriaceae bacterium]
MSEYTIGIEGMHCANCVKRVTAALEGLEGAKDVSVDLEGKCAKLSASAGEDSIREAVEDLGFEVVSVEVR